MPWSLPSEADRARLTDALDELAKAMEQTQLPLSNPTAQFVWDFVKVYIYI